MKRASARPAALLAALAGHALLLALLAAALAPSPRGHDAPATRPPLLWLHAPPPAVVPPAVVPPAVFPPAMLPPATAGRVPAATPPTRAPARPATPPPAAPVALPTGEPVTAAITVPGPATAAAPASAASAPPPLDLRLRPGSVRHAPAAALARDDPRLPPARTREDRLADALGTDTRLREQTLADGSRRLRRGSACVRAHTARDAQLDPFNQSTRPTPALVGAC